jgi:hypothetical protein
MALDLTQLVFQDKKLEDLIKEVYDNHKSQDETLKKEIARLLGMISSPGDAIVIIPMIKSLMDSSLKNDESILKLVQVFQKSSDTKKDTEDDLGILTEKDVEQLFSEINIIKAPKAPKDKKDTVNIVDGK